jgi:tetratricopeptide (TPR) repeat protein
MHVPSPDQNPWQEREEKTREALRLFEELKDHKGIANALLIRASVMGPHEGIALLERSLMLAEEAGDDELIVAAHRQLGNIHGLSRDKENALFHKEQAEQLARAAGDEFQTAWALFSRAISLPEHEQEESLRLVREAEAIFRRLGRDKQVASMLMWIAVSLPDEALEERKRTHAEAREFARRAGVDIWEASQLRCLADIAEKEGKPDEARRMREEADSIYYEEPNPELDRMFEEAFSSEDPGRIFRVMKNLFGGGGVKRFRAAKRKRR